METINSRSQENCDARSKDFTSYVILRKLQPVAEFAVIWNGTSLNYRCIQHEVTIMHERTFRWNIDESLHTYQRRAYRRYTPCISVYVPR